MEREETNDYDDYDEKIVVVTLNGVLDTDPIHKAIHSGGVRIRTVDCEEPIVQIGSSVYTGKWNQTVGTDLIFCTNDTQTQKVDSKPKLDLLAVSETRLVAQKALLVSTEVDNDECVHTEDSIQPQEFCADEEIMSEVGQMADVEEHSFDDSLT